MGRPIRQQPTFVGVGWTRRGLCPGPRPGQAQFFSHLGKQRVETRETHLFTSIQADRERPWQSPPHPFRPQYGQTLGVPAEPGQLCDQTSCVTGDRQILTRERPSELHRFVNQGQAPRTVPPVTTCGFPSSAKSTEPTTFTSGSKIQSPLIRRLSAPRSDGGCGIRASKSWMVL